MVSRGGDISGAVFGEVPPAESYRGTLTVEGNPEVGFHVCRGPLVGVTLPV